MESGFSQQNADPEWKFAGTFYDEGITGRKQEERDGLKSLF